ncbi:hypothetical protein [Saccharothrix xinjiangensis]|uniref:Uncharacterized protein n=1 Tax=Saccharothrix xinjiangensis TaxID=204798 RepID=A0ABV9XT43_9PSEU
MRVNQIIAATATFAAVVLAPVLGATAAHAATPAPAAVVVAEDTPWGPTGDDTPWGPTGDDTPWGPTGA